MANYVDQVLVEGERVLGVGRLSLWSFWHLIVLGLIFLPAFGAGLIFWLVVYIRIKSTELAVTTKRIIVKYGFIRRDTIEMSLAKVESLQVTQSLAGRLFNFGTLVIAGTGASHAPLEGIAEPLVFRNAFVQAQDRAGKDF